MLRQKDVFREIAKPDHRSGDDKEPISVKKINQILPLSSHQDHLGWAPEVMPVVSDRPLTLEGLITRQDVMKSDAALFSDNRRVAEYDFRIRYLEISIRLILTVKEMTWKALSSNS